MEVITIKSFTGKTIFFILLPDVVFDLEPCFWKAGISNIKFFKNLSIKKCFYFLKNVLHAVLNASLKNIFVIQVLNKSRI